MELITCRNGHRYDPSLTESCPECARQEAWFNITDDETTDFGPALRICSRGHTYDPKLTSSCPICSICSFEETDAEETKDPAAGLPDVPETKAVTAPKPAGWLVGIRGTGYGRAYMLHEENNYIGRSPDNDISIPDDPTVSAGNHCVITYDPLDRRFYVGLSGGASIVRLNENPVLMPMELKAGDRLRIGRGTYRFVPLCGEDFDWKDWPETP